MNLLYKAKLLVLNMAAPLPCVLNIDALLASKASGMSCHSQETHIRATSALNREPSSSLPRGLLITRCWKKLKFQHFNSLCICTSSYRNIKWLAFTTLPEVALGEEGISLTGMMSRWTSTGRTTLVSSFVSVYNCLPCLTTWPVLHITWTCRSFPEGSSR